MITKEQILEGILIISEFMNNKIWMVKYYDDDTQPDRIEILIKDYDVFIKKGFELDIYAKPYHLNYNLLMSVIEKIEHINESETCYGTLCTIDTVYIRIGNITKDLKLNEYSSKKEGTWLAIVEFIKYYNQNK
jgi:hypothetical protein